MLAKNVLTTRSSSMPALSLTTFASKLAPMYGLAPTFNPLFKHCYPVASMYQAYSRKPKQLLANIGSARDMPITVRPQGPVGAQASVRDGLTRGQCSLAWVGAA